MLERTNVRDATPATIGGIVELVVVDVSFISLTAIIPVLVTLCQPGSPMVLLVKPKLERQPEPEVAAEVTVKPAGKVRTRLPVEVALRVKVRLTTAVSPALVRERSRLLVEVRPATLKFRVSESV